MFAGPHWERSDQLFGMLQGWLWATRQMPAVMGTSVMQPEAAPGQHQTTESALRKAPTLFGGLPERSTPNSLLRPSRWVKKRPGSTLDGHHAAGWPQSGRPWPIVRHSGVRVLGHLEPAFQERSVLGCSRIAASSAVWSLSLRHSSYLSLASKFSTDSNFYLEEKQLDPQ